MFGKKKKVKPLDEKPFKRKDRKAMRRAVLAMRVSLLIIIAAAVIALLAVFETTNAISMGQSTIQYDELGDMVLVPEEEYFDFFNQEFSHGLFRRTKWLVSCIFSLLVHYFRRGWQPVSAYRLSISLLYLAVSIPTLIHWWRKRRQIKLELSVKENQYQLEWVDKEILERGGTCTVGNILFGGIAILLIVVQYILPFASFKMIPVLWVFNAFLAGEIICWVVLRARFRLDRTEPQPKTRGVVRSKKSNITRVSKKRRADKDRAAKIASSMIRNK